MPGVDTPAGRFAGWSDDDLAVVWVCGLGALAGPLGGTLLGYLYGRDQALTPAAVPWYAVGGFLAGSVAGMLSGLAPAGLLVALGHQTWATPPVRVALTALAGAAPLTLWQLLSSGFDIAGETVVIGAVMTSAPPALAAACLAHRSRPALPRWTRPRTRAGARRASPAPSPRSPGPHGCAHRPRRRPRAATRRRAVASAVLAG